MGEWWHSPGNILKQINSLNAVVENILMHVTLVCQEFIATGFTSLHFVKAE